ncbi:MAG: nickel insertion protein [Chloroflexota bacterium]
MKRSYFRGNEVSVKPEYDDCRRIASEKNIPVKEVYSRILSKLISKTSK